MVLNEMQQEDARVRRKLIALIQLRGAELIEDRTACEGLIRDHCGYSQQANLIVGALQQGIPERLRQDDEVPSAVLIPSLAARLSRSLGTLEEAARWSVETWAMALGVTSGDGTTSFEQPAPARSRREPRAVRANRRSSTLATALLVIGVAGVVLASGLGIWMFAFSSSENSGVSLRDDFNDPDAGILQKSSDEPDLYSVGYVDGEYEIKTLDPALDHPPSVLIPNGPYRDVRIGIDARIIGDAKDRVVELACRDSGPSGGQYRLTVSPAEQAFLLNRWDGSDISHLVNWTRSQDIESDASNRIELECVGNRITVKVNGKVISSAVDGAYQSGDAWFDAYAYDGQLVDARFDKLEVTGH